jgi:hypothetical protein
MTALLDFLRHPPGWVLALLLVWMVSEVLKRALHLPRENIIVAIEFIVVVVLSALILHSSFQTTVTGSGVDDHPIYFITALIVFALLSMILYIIDRRQPRT